jgi:hypothetical protein
MGLMKKLHLIAILGLLGACTSSRWIVQETPADDLSQSKVISTVPVLAVKQLPTPDQPTIVFEVRNLNEVQFPQRMEQRRYVQKYRPRYGLMLLGLTGAAALVYVANTNAVLEKDLTKNQKLGLNITAGVLATGSIFNLKPTGEPLFTGETRMLEQVGTASRNDTVARPQSSQPVSMDLFASYRGTPVVEGLTKIGTNQEIRIDLVNELPFRSFETTEPGMVELLLTAQDRTFTYEVPVESFLKRYVRVARRNTPIRSSPQDQAGNIITTVAEASLMPWINTADGWHEVMLGLNPVFMRAEDAAVVWMPAGGVGGMVISTGQRFGDIDVERGLPTGIPLQMDAAAVIIANQNYDDASLGNRYAERSIELMKEYYHNVLGVPIDRIRVVKDAPSSQSATWSRFQRNNIWSELRMNPDRTRLFVYYVGKGATIEGKPVLLPTDAPNGEPVDVGSFLEYVASFPTMSTHVMFETDFTHTPDGTALGVNSLSTTADLLTQRRAGWVMFASDVRQPAGAYTTEDFRTDRIYGLMTYFFCKALQEENFSTSEIQNYLNRNLTFTSRRIHNRPQDPKIFGQTNLRLIDYP